ncbi:hypothetical protein [Streptomyces sp. NPDC059786]|uniref:hypothetical protein n=1 Tax=Streptomyces sp. NPDC059786 TaxID=3346946 RepID=UPI003656CCCF
MADEHTVSADEWGIHALTLTAAEETIVRFAADCDQIEILSHDGTAPIYFTVDGSPAAVEGPTCRVIPASISSATVHPPTPGGTVVRLISAGTPTVSVSRA